MILCSIPALAALFASCTPAPFAVGYVEGEYILVAPSETARIEALFVDRGDRIQTGSLLATLEKRDVEILVAKAQATLARAQSELADLNQGARAEEVAVAEAAVDSAAVEYGEAKRELDRLLGLFERGVTPQSQIDLAKTKVAVAAARLRQVRADLAVIKLPARPDRIAAAEAAVAEAKAALDASKWRLGERTLVATASGKVTDIYRFPGDLAGPQAPILSILPDGGTKLRFYVPEASYSQVALGTELDVICDGCPSSFRVEVSYLATNPEFTPPVIYSLDARQKLVFLAEARISDAQNTLKPGQIVDVHLPEPSE